MTKNNHGDDTLQPTPTPTPHHHQLHNEGLITTTPITLQSSLPHTPSTITSIIHPSLHTGIQVRKISSKGHIAPRILTLSRDLFTLFLSHHHVAGRNEDEKLKQFFDKVSTTSQKAYTKFASAVTGFPVHAKRDIRVIDVADILFVQSGFIGSRKLEAGKRENEDAKGGSVVVDERKVVSIFYKDMKSIDLLVEGEEEREWILGALREVREAYVRRKEGGGVGRLELLLRYTWYDTDCNKSGYIDQSEFLQLLSRINIYLKQEKAIHVYKKFIKEQHHNNQRKSKLSLRKFNKQHGITLEECVYLLRKIRKLLHATSENEKERKRNNSDHRRNEISDAIFDRLFGPEREVVSAREFLHGFLHWKQNDGSATLEDVQNLFKKLNSMELSQLGEDHDEEEGGRVHGGEDGDDNDGVKENNEETIDRLHFAEYLFGPHNDAFHPEKAMFDRALMDKPLSHYWINTSHNTYLTGDQLKSLSSVEMYAAALQRGCKCLEIDCWDSDSKTNTPVVYHGYTVTSKIPFNEIISCVKAYVDANPETFPIILSLENHCTHPFQKMMAHTLETTLGNALYIPKPGTLLLPSPMELVGKVLIKGKRPAEKEDDETITVESVDQTLPDGKENSSEPVLPKICPELARLTMFNGVKYRDFEQSNEMPCTDMHSFSETKVSKLMKDPTNLFLWRKYNLDHLSRTYPAGGRVDSSNYNPIVAWSLGCQMVALNFQTDDSAMVLNDGRFRENGGCGYVLRPRGSFPMNEDRNSWKGRVMLRIRVLAAACLPKPNGDIAGEVIDPFVVVRVHDMIDSVKVDGSGSSSPKSSVIKDLAGISITGIKNSVVKDITDKSKVVKRSISHQVEILETTERKTDTVKDNGFCPQWDDSEVFSFTVSCPDVAMVQIVVMDDDGGGLLDDTVCKAAIPVSCLRQGYRSVRLNDQYGSQHGPFGFARLLLDVSIEPCP